MRSSVLALCAALFGFAYPALAQMDNDFSGGGAVRIGISGTTCNGGAEGAIRYNTTANVIEFCNGSAWTLLAAGGANTQVQFNNSGAFGGSANMTWDGTTFLVSHAAASATAGVHGSTSSTTASATGVRGAATGATGATSGVYGSTSSTTGTAAGVRGRALAGSGAAYGVYGHNASTTAGAAGVMGQTTTSGATYGVYGLTNSGTGWGVYGYNNGSGGIAIQGDADTGAAIGVYGGTGSTSNWATGVQGSATGATVGVRGSSSATGYGGYFSNSNAGGTGVYVPDGSYAQFADFNAGAPAAGDCDNDAERGRLSIDTTNNRLYVCNGATRGWDYAALTN